MEFSEAHLGMCLAGKTGPPVYLNSAECQVQLLKQVSNNKGKAESRIPRLGPETQAPRFLWLSFLINFAHSKTSWPIWLSCCWDLASNFNIIRSLYIIFPVARGSENYLPITFVKCRLFTSIAQQHTAGGIGFLTMGMNPSSVIQSWVSLSSY